MWPASTLIAFAAAASAADLRGYTETNCGGGYATCGDVPSGTCCTVVNNDQGSPSVAVVYASPATQLFGYQRTRDGQICGAIAKQQATGPYDFLCMSADAGTGTFSAARWYPPGSRRRRTAETCAADAQQACTQEVKPNQVVLKDGHLFEIGSVDEATHTEFLNLAFNGSTVADVPEHLAAFEQDCAGVAARLEEIRSRR